jgi:hypothetical protein
MASIFNSSGTSKCLGTALINTHISGEAGVGNLSHDIRTNNFDILAN